jgi:amidase
LLPPAAGGGTAKPTELLIARDAFALCDSAVQEALAPVVRRVATLAPAVREITLAADGIAHWCAHQRLLQSHEFGRTFKAWVAQHNPVFSFDVAQTLVQAQSLTEADVLASRQLRSAVRARLDELLAGERLLCLPTAPILPIRRGASLPEMQRAVDRILLLTCIAGLTGLPQMNLPLGHSGGIPVGLSLIGPRGSDRLLLAVAREIESGLS